MQRWTEMVKTNARKVKNSKVEEMENFLQNFNKA